jgi:hypothetical protein
VLVVCVVKWVFVFLFSAVLSCLTTGFAFFVLLEGMCLFDTDLEKDRRRASWRVAGLVLILILDTFLARAWQDLFLPLVAGGVLGLVVAIRLLASLARD